ncbi:MAG: SurA N-terminal domain-containing protein [Deltaproteobacteria bacterium]|jgi:peptidyl-prolyl cis-trans isomerase D|nr:SurA N-terminal domain-containing protein [Deltaproteobacteria bacterium]
MLDIIRQKSNSLGVKIIFGLIIVVFVFWGASAVNTNSAAVLATVNDRPINGQDFQIEFQRTMEMLRDAPEFASMDNDQREELGQIVLGNMVSRELMRQEAERLGLGVSDYELSYAINTMPEFHGADGKFSESEYKARLASVGMTPGYFERMITTDLMTGKLRSYIVSGVDISPEQARQDFNFEYERRVVDYLFFPAAEFAAQVKPDEKEIAAYYEANKSAFLVPAKADFDYLALNLESLGAGLEFSDADLEKLYFERESQFRIPTRYHSRHILIAVPAVPADGAEQADPAKAETLAAEKVAQVVAELKAGKSFASLAAQYSDDVQTKDNGGSLDWIQEGQAEAVFEQAALALKPGAYSEPVRSSFGYHVIMLEAVEPGRQQAFAEVKDELQKLKREEEAYRLLNSNDIEDAIITLKELPALADKYGLQVQNSGLAVVDELAARLFIAPAALSNLAAVTPGSVLPLPVATPDGFLVLKLNKFNPEYVAGLDEVRGDIESLLRERGAFELTMSEADKVSKEIAASGGELPAAQRARLQSSRPVDRRTGIAELGFSPILAESVFAAKPGVWQDTVFSTSNGAVLVLVRDVLPPSQQEWNELGARFTAQAGTNARNNMLNVYMNMLYKQAEVERMSERIFIQN